MSKLCDPDINMIVLPGCKTPEPSIRQMIYHWYDSNGIGSEQSKLFTDQYLSEQNEICTAALDRVREEAREEALREAMIALAQGPIGDGKLRERSAAIAALITKDQANG
jgi:hypothetical protein